MEGYKRRLGNQKTPEKRHQNAFDLEGRNLDDFFL